MKNKLYLLIVAVTLTFCVFTQGDFPRFLLGFEFLLWITLYVCSRILGGCVQKEMTAPFSEAVREQEIPLEVRLTNNSFFPVSEIRVRIKCRDVFSDQVQILDGIAMLDGYDQTVMRYVIRPKHYGILSVWGETVEIGDPLGIHFAVSRFAKHHWQIAVAPELQEKPEQRFLSGEEKQAVESGYNQEGRGEDQSAAYELRRYQEGEPLRNVHWKMTAKTDELMVKEFANDTESMNLVYLDLDTYGKQYSRCEWDSFLETVASFAASQIREGKPSEFIWLNGQAQPCRMQVRCESDGKMALTALLHEKPRTMQTGETADKEKWIHETYGAVVRLNLWGQITREESAR